VSALARIGGERQDHPPQSAASNSRPTFSAPMVARCSGTGYPPSSIIGIEASKSRAKRAMPAAARGLRANRATEVILALAHHPRAPACCVTRTLTVITPSLRLPLTPHAAGWK